MGNRKYYLICLFLILALGMNSLKAQRVWSSQRRSPKKFWMLISYGNLTGVGLGLNYIFSRTFSFDAIGGMESPVHIIWAPPYTGTTLNILLRVNWTHRSGFYLSCGGYAGLFELSKKLESVDEPVYSVNYGPALSLGFEYPRKSRGKRVSLEIGVVFNLPEHISRTINEELGSSILDVNRSLASTGAVYPFFQLMLRL